MCQSLQANAAHVGMGIRVPCSMGTYAWYCHVGDRPTAQRILASSLLQKKSHQRDNSRENYGALPLQPIQLQK